MILIDVSMILTDVKSRRSTLIVAYRYDYRFIILRRSNSYTPAIKKFLLPLKCQDILASSSIL